MLMEGVKKALQEAADALRGHARRVFMARTVKQVFDGVIYRAEQELGWCRPTVKKGMQELETGVPSVDGRKGATGRKPVEARLPHLLDDMRDIMQSQCCTDPTFKTNRLYRRLSARVVRELLVSQKEYSTEELPSEEGIRIRLDKLGFYPRRVQKSKPKKKIPETDAIFEQMNEVRQEVRQNESQLELSLDAKATVKLGELSRGGKERVEVKAMDHDMDVKGKVTPYAIFLPQFNETYLYMVTSKVTSDCMVDCLQDLWTTLRPRFSTVTMLLLLQDNGPENQSHRTQFLKRMVDFVCTHGIGVRLAYYPPYHSKYNPVERVLGVLERSWSGALLDSVETVVNYAKNMTYNGVAPVVKVVEEVYETGVTVAKESMAAVEAAVDRLSSTLGRWFVDILCPNA